MPERKLTQIVNELTGRLDEEADLDEKSRDALRGAAASIRSALASEEPTDSQLAGLRERLERFEGAHPALTEVVRRLVDQLSEMGI